MLDKVMMFYAMHMYMFEAIANGGFVVVIASQAVVLLKKIGTKMIQHQEVSCN